MGTIISAAAVILVVFGAVKLIPGIFAVMGNKAYAEDDTEKALRYYKTAVKLSGGNVSRRTTYALLLMRTGNFKEAETLLNSVILSGAAKTADKANAKTFRCMIYQKTGRLDDAIEDAEELYENSKNTLVYGMLGYLRQLKGGAELDLCLEAYEYNSDDRDICDNLAVAYLRTGDFENAARILKKLREDFPKFTEAFYHSALLALKTGDKNAALGYLEKIPECKRTALTTVSQEKINKLGEDVRAL